MNINSRKKTFYQDLIMHLAMLPDGSWRYRKKAKITLQNITNDLAYLGILPLKLKHVEVHAITDLVNYWKEMRLTPKTIKNKLAILRQLLAKADHAVVVPSNRELGVTIKKRNPIMQRRFEIIEPLHISLYPVSLVKEICNFQYLFGLKLYEAIKIDSSMVHNHYLEIHHSISFNKKDRRILVDSAEQKEFVQHFRTDLKTLLPITQDYYPAFIALYQFTQKQLHIEHPDYFRNLYIKKRYQDLLLKHDQFTTLEILKDEVGYSRVGQVKEVLACQENF